MPPRQWGLGFEQGSFLARKSLKGDGCGKAVYLGTGRYADADRVLKQLVGLSPNPKYAKAIRENQIVWQNAARFQQQM